MVNTKIEGYAGDITSIEAWKILKNDKASLLIDVRSEAEWAYVGVTDLASINKEAATIEWKNFLNQARKLKI